MAAYFTIRWDNGVVKMIDQRVLPHKVVYLEYNDLVGVANAIQNMVIRGAPAIGAAAAYGMSLAAKNSIAKNRNDFISDLQQSGEILRASRPTAANLAWAVERITKKVLQSNEQEVSELVELVIAEAININQEDIRINRRMAEIGLKVVPQNANIIHHCNTGALATVDHGTALGVIRTAHEAKKNIHVYVDETRPRLQGARLTTWELEQLGIPYTLIVDGSSGFFMRRGNIDLALVGCDRVAANGDTANKIGTFNLALAAYAHGIPFYVVGPTSTVDLNLKHGDLIPIEERDASEVTKIGDYTITPEKVSAANPAFDITPAKYITGIITEMGIAKPPYTKSLAEFCAVL